jgi:hypothetical protein
MKKSVIAILKRSVLCVSYQTKGIVRVTDNRRAWSDSTVEFTDPTGELLAIKTEELDLKERLYEAMRVELSDFWKSKECVMKGIVTEEVEKDIPF